MNEGEKRLYVANSLSQQLILLYLLGNTLFTILYVNRMNVDAALGIFVMLNIFLSLVRFSDVCKAESICHELGLCRDSRWLHFNSCVCFGFRQRLLIRCRIVIVALLILTSVAAFAASIILHQTRPVNAKNILLITILN